MLILQLMVAMALTCRPVATRPQCEWDLSYRSAVQGALGYPTSISVVPSRRELEELRRGLTSLPERKTFAERAKSAGRILDEVLVESIGQNPPGYRGVWVVRTEVSATAFVLVVIGIERMARDVTVSPEQWEKLAGLATATRTESWLGRKSNDAPAYFVSTAVGGVCRQFSLYSPIFSQTIPKADREYNEWITSEKALIGAVLSLSKDTSQTPTPAPR